MESDLGDMKEKIKARKDQMWEDFVFSGPMTQVMVAAAVLVVLAVFFGVVFLAPTAPTNVWVKDMIVEYKKGNLLTQSGEAVLISAPGKFMEYRRIPPQGEGLYVIEKEKIDANELQELAMQFNEASFRSFKQVYNEYGDTATETTTITVRSRGVSHTVISYDNSAPQEFFELESSIRAFVVSKIPKAGRNA